jgi:hypothetical protein
MKLRGPALGWIAGCHRPRRFWPSGFPSYRVGPVYRFLAHVACLVNDPRACRQAQLLRLHLRSRAGELWGRSQRDRGSRSARQAHAARGESVRNSQVLARGLGQCALPRAIALVPATSCADTVPLRTICEQTGAICNIRGCEGLLACLGPVAVSGNRLGDEAGAAEDVDRLGDNPSGRPETVPHTCCASRLEAAWATLPGDGSLWSVWRGDWEVEWPTSPATRALAQLRVGDGAQARR